jgi:transposase
MAAALEEACVGAHHLSCTLKALGHGARLMPAKYVRSYTIAMRKRLRGKEGKLKAERLRPLDQNASSLRVLVQLDGEKGRASRGNGPATVDASFNQYFRFVN